MPMPAGVQQTVGDVVDRAQPTQQVELLEDESDVVRPQRR
jgi:hypothetical protein